MENIHMNINELRSFLQETRNRNVNNDRVALQSIDSCFLFACLKITNINDLQCLYQLVNEFEKKPDLKSRHILSLDGI